MEIQVELKFDSIIEVNLIQKFRTLSINVSSKSGILKKYHVFLGKSERGDY